MNLPVYNYKQFLFIPGYISCTEVYPMKIVIPAFFSLAFVCQIFSYLLPFKLYAYLQLKCFSLAFLFKTECFNNTVQIFTFNYVIIFFQSKSANFLLNFYLPNLVLFHAFSSSFFLVNYIHDSSFSLLCALPASSVLFAFFLLFFTLKLLTQCNIIPLGIYQKIFKIMLSFSPFLSFVAIHVISTY